MVTPRGQRYGPGGGDGRQRDGGEALMAAHERSAFHRSGIDLLCVAGLDGRIDAMSGGWSDLLGWSPAELRAGLLLDLIHPDDRRLVAAELGTISAERRTRGLEIRWRCRDQSYRWLSFTARSMGEGGQIAAVAQDITERKERETQLQRGHDFLQLVQFVANAANGAPTALTHALQATLDAVCANTGWTIGHVLRVSDDGRDDLVSSGIWHIDDGRTLEGMRRRHDQVRFARGVGVPGRVLATGTAEHIADIRSLTDRNEDLVRCALIDERKLRAVAGFPIKAQATVLGVLEFFSETPFECDDLLLDVMVQVGAQVGRIVERSRYEEALRKARTEAETARAQAEAAQDEAESARAQAEAASGAKTEFLSRMSHELRTPLNSVLGFAELLGLGAMDSQEKEYLAEIESGGSHLLALINDVLDVARIEEGRLQLSLDAVAVDDVVLDVLSLLQPLALARRVSLKAGVGALSGLFVRADHRRLRQVLMNLVANGIKYNRENGDVAVAVLENRESVRIEVRDTGAGIDEKNLAAIFVPFERLSATREVEGTGLGLSLSKHLTEGMGGVIEVCSTLGVGSTFAIVLPAAPAPEPAAAPAPAPQLAQSASSGARHKVLYIDDNTSNVALMKGIFMLRPRVELVPTTAGSDALRLAAEHSPCLILLDVQLPDMPGAEVLRRLRADPTTCGIPVVMVSADASTWQIERLMAAGASAYMTKPIAIAELLATVDRATGGGADGLEVVGRRSAAAAEAPGRRS